MPLSSGSGDYSKESSGIPLCSWLKRDLGSQKVNDKVVAGVFNNFCSDCLTASPS